MCLAGSNMLVIFGRFDAVIKARRAIEAIWK